MSTPKIIVPRPDPTISSSGLSSSSNPPCYRAHRWGGMSHVPWWSLGVYECNPVWSIRPLLLAPPPLGILPRPILHKFFRHPRNTPGRLVAKPLQDIQHFPHYHPTFAAVQQHCMWHCLVHHTKVPKYLPHFLQHFRYHTPLSPHFPQVMEHRRPIANTHTCERGSSIFYAMSQINFLSTTRESLPRMWSTARKNG